MGRPRLLGRKNGFAALIRRAIRPFGRDRAMSAECSETRTLAASANKAIRNTSLRGPDSVTVHESGAMDQSGTIHFFRSELVFKTKF